MKKTDDLISFISQGRPIKFTKGDVKIFLDYFVEYLEICAENGEELKIRGLGKMYGVPIPSRKIKSFTDKNGEFHQEVELPPTVKLNFRLAENIRNRAKSNP